LIRTNGDGGHCGGKETVMANIDRDETAPRALGLGLAAGLFGMGAVFAARPQAGSQVFGLPTSGSGLPYVRALAFRDFAIAAALGMAAAAPKRVLGLLAASLAIIPAADAMLVARRRGGGAAGSLALHGGSAAALALLAILCLRPGARP
jgi:hypothetical protein